MKVMDEGFEPKKRGRPPLVDATQVIHRLKNAQVTNPGQWVMFDSYDHNEVRSLKKQLMAQGVEVSISTRTQNPVIYARMVRV